MSELTVVSDPVSEPEPDYESMSDRELLIELAKSHREIKQMVTEIFDTVGPTVDALKNSPVFKMLGVK